MPTSTRRALLTGLAYAVTSIRNPWLGTRSSAADNSPPCLYELEIGNWIVKASDKDYGAILIQEKILAGDGVVRRIAGVRSNNPGQLNVDFTAHAEFEVKNAKEELDYDGFPTVEGTVALEILTEHNSKRRWLDASLEAENLAPSTPKFISLAVPTDWFHRPDDLPTRLTVRHKREYLLILELDDGLEGAMWLAKHEFNRLATSVQKGECHTPNCFVTSACVEALGLTDDCFELRALRKFRDQWLALVPWGPRQIALYYQVAPAIVAAIRSQPDEGLLINVYFRYVLPAALFSRIGLNILAYKLYTKMMVRLIGKYHSSIRSMRQSGAASRCSRAIQHYSGITADACLNGRGVPFRSPTGHSRPFR